MNFFSLKLSHSHGSQITFFFVNMFLSKKKKPSGHIIQAKEKTNNRRNKRKRYTEYDILCYDRVIIDDCL